MRRPGRAAALVAAVLLCGCGRSDTSDSDAVAGPPGSLLPRDPAALAAALAVPVDSLQAAGEERYARQAYDSARAIWEVAAARAGARADSAAEARARMWIGLAAWRLGDYAAASREGEASLTLKRRLGLDDELSRSFNALGLLAWNEGRHHQALQHFDSAIAAARRHDDAAGVLRATANVPLVRVELGDFDGAREGLAAVLAAGHEARDDRTVGNALANLAMLEIRLGRPLAALPRLAEARRRYAAVGYATGEANALGQLATAFGGLGDLQRAIAAADSGLAIARAHGLQQEVASALEVLADLHVQAGDPRLALQHLREADRIDSTLGLVVEQGTNLRRSSLILLRLGEAATAIERARQALAIHRASDARAEAVYDRLQLARSLAGGALHMEAAAEVRRAIEEAARLGHPAARREAVAVAARLTLDTGRPADALAVMDAPSPGAEDAPDAEETVDWRLRDLRTEALFALHLLSEARTEGERTIAALERERASLGVGPLRAGYLANRTAPYARLVAIHLALGDTIRAFEVAASLPGRSLAERMGGVPDVPVDVAGLAEGERLLGRAAALEQELTEAAGEPGSMERRVALERALAAARNAYVAHLAARALAPSAHARTLGLDGVRLGEVQRRLRSGEVLLTTVAGPDRLDAFLVTVTGIAYHAVPVTDRALALRVRVAREELERGTHPTRVHALHDLHDLLLRPLIASGMLREARRLLVVPHGPLAALPFSALRDRRTGRYLIEDVVIAHLPTAAAIAAGARDRRVTDGLAVFVPMPASLPGTRREAAAIAALLEGTEVRLGGASRERDVRAALEAGRPVHVASHGVQNGRNPLFSHITVGTSRRPAAGDGRLEVHEILGLRIRSPLVFLSGCETGLATTGDGAFSQQPDGGSLAQALLAAGARSVVATLWRVGDDAAAGLATSFYRHLRTGLDPATALARAQRDAIATGVDLGWGAYIATGVGAQTDRAGP